MRFGHLEIFTKNIESSVDFYRDLLGFKETIRIGNNFVWMKLDSLEILLRLGSPQPATKKYEDGSQGLVLYTDNVFEMKKELENKGLKFLGTVDSDKCFTFKDPNGIWYQLVDPNDH